MMRFHLLLVSVSIPLLAVSALKRTQLVRNGGAEEGTGNIDRSDVDSIPLWIRSGMTVVKYGASPYSSPKPAEQRKVKGGTQFFSCGWHADSAMWQLIALNNYKKDFKAGNVEATLTGWIGGMYGNSLYVQATFLSDMFTNLGSLLLPPLTRKEFAKIDSLLTPVFLSRGASMLVPANAAWVNVTVVATNSGRFKFCDAYLDNVALYLESGIHKVLTF